MVDNGVDDDGDDDGVDDDGDDDGVDDDGDDDGVDDDGGVFKYKEIVIPTTILNNNISINLFIIYKIYK